MLLIPAWVWRGGFVHRAVCAGVPAGIFLAALAFAESGVMLGAVAVFVVVSVFNGIMMARRMGKAWPAATDLSPDDRVVVSSAVRRGRRIDEPALAPAAMEYVGALRDARRQARRWRWLVWLAAAAMLVLAAIDSLFSTPRVAAVSWLIVALFAVEILWWPRIQDRLVANAERTVRALSRRRVDDE